MDLATIHRISCLVVSVVFRAWIRTQVRESDGWLGDRYSAKTKCLGRCGEYSRSGSLKSCSSTTMMTDGMQEISNARSGEHHEALEGFEVVSNAGC